jgi:K+-transporting ATPase KdpF subunit
MPLVHAGGATFFSGTSQAPLRPFAARRSYAGCMVGGLVISVLLLVYLVYAMLRPEKF